MNQDVYNQTLDILRAYGYDFSTAHEIAARKASESSAEQQWREASAGGLEVGDAVRFLDDETDHVVTARWDENGEAKFLSKTVATGRSDGLSAVRPSYAVLIRK